jgi:hypothetical protein
VKILGWVWYVWSAFTLVNGLIDVPGLVRLQRPSAYIAGHIGGVMLAAAIMAVFGVLCVRYGDQPRKKKKKRRPETIAEEWGESSTPRRKSRPASEPAASMRTRDVVGLILAVPLAFLVGLVIVGRVVKPGKNARPAIAEQGGAETETVPLPPVPAAPARQPASDPLVFAPPSNPPVELPVPNAFTLRPVAPPAVVEAPAAVSAAPLPTAPAPTTENTPPGTRAITEDTALEPGQRLIVRSSGRWLVGEVVHARSAGKVKVHFLTLPAAFDKELERSEMLLPIPAEELDKSLVQTLRFPLFPNQVPANIDKDRVETELLKLEGYLPGTMKVEVKDRQVVLNAVAGSSAIEDSKFALLRAKVFVFPPLIK